MIHSHKTLLFSHTPLPHCSSIMLPLRLSSQAQELYELEGATGVDAGGTGPMFKVLKGLVEVWLADAGRRSNP